jgi:AraC-like DNA-binding protein
VKTSIYAIETTSYRALRLEHVHRAHWILSHVQAGIVTTSTGDERREAAAGSVMLHPPGVPFSEIAEGPGTHQWIEFELKVPPNLDLFALYPVDFVVPLQDPQAYSRIFAELEAAMRAATSELANLSVTTRLLDLARLVIDNWEADGARARPSAGNVPNERFRSVIAYMNDHIDARISRETLARQVHLHPSYFDRVFRAAFGVAPMQLLREMRLTRARHLLETTELGLEAIAERCGLGDAAYLSRQFRARHGTTPGKHRESVKSASQSYIPSSPGTRKLS